MVKMTKTTLVFTAVSALILLILNLILNFLSKKTFYDREKSAPFECGFDPKNSARLPFSLHFFLIAIIFVIFDVELTLFMPFIVISKLTQIQPMMKTLTLFIIIMMIGLIHELKQGSLNWTT